ncbi:hypothetical protein GGR53DRAFT_464997 [Hypoxylon sp. FL1150]|nr:hypothetical protein GGR53DRAFT_464997 [Hypoxylon sp. FL1150]
MSSSGEEEVVYDRNRASALRNNRPAHLTANIGVEQTQVNREFKCLHIDDPAPTMQDIQRYQGEGAHASRAASSITDSNRSLPAQGRRNPHNASQYITQDFWDTTTPLFQERVSELWAAQVKAFTPAEQAHIARSPSPFDLAADQASDSTSQSTDSFYAGNPILPYLLAEFPDIRPTPTIPMVVRGGGAPSEHSTQSVKGKEKAASMNSAPSVQMSQKLLNHSARDGLTLVGSRMTIWNDYAKENAHVDWPPADQFRRDGSGLPRPRIQQIDDKFVHFARTFGTIPETGPGVPYSLRKLAPFSLFPAADGLTTEEFRDCEMKAKEIREKEIHRSLKKFP